MKRFVLVAALLALAVPGSARADATVHTAPFAAGPRGGDQYNQFMSDPATGEMTVLRVNPAGISGGLGCGGTGGFDNFVVTHAGEGPISKVTVAYNDAVIDPYTWINVGVRQGDHFLASRVERGIIAGAGVVTVNLPANSVGPVTVWFGIQVVSACPNIDGGTALFESVTVE